MHALVARQDELATLEQWLAEPACLAVIVGPGGIGKTALAAGARHLEATSHWVDLSAATGRDDVDAAVAAALGGDESGSYTAGELIARAAPALIVFDCADRAVDSLAELLGHAPAPGARWLVTSRRALPGPARVMRLGPLPVPARGDDAARAWASPACRLFALRAEAYGDVVLDRASPGDGELIARIVRRLEGHPLAIEIAASKLRLLSLAQVADRIDDALRLVDRDRADRHRSLTAVLEWSWSLLSPPAQRAAAMLSLFEGRFSVDEAELLLPDGDALELLEDLYRDSWLTSADADRERHYRFFDFARRFLGERLGADREQAERRHSEFAVARARQLVSDFERGAPDRLRRELADRMFDFAAAIGQFEARGDAPAVAVLAIALASAYSQLGQMGRGLDLLRSTWETTRGRLDADEQGRLLWYVEMFSSLIGGPPVAGDAGLDALIAGSKPSFLIAQVQLVQAMSVGDNRAALAHLERAEALASETDHPVGRASCAMMRCILEPLTGRFAGYTHYMAPALAQLREAGAHQLEGFAWNYFATGHLIAGKYQEALRCTDSALRMLRQFGNRYFVSVATMIRGWALDGIGDTAQAEALVRDALAGCRQAGSARAVSWCQYLLGAQLLEQGRTGEALIQLDEAIAQLVADESNPFLTLAHSRRSIALASLGRVAEAEAATAAARQVLARCTDLPMELVLELDACTVARAAGGDPSAEWSRLCRAASAAGLIHYDAIRVSIGLHAEPHAQRGLIASPDFHEITTPEGSVIDLGRQAASRRMLIAMADTRRPLSVAELFAAGWPQQRIAPASAARRVYSAIYLLRRRGLDRWIEHDGDGYRLTAEVDRRGN